MTQKVKAKGLYLEITRGEYLFINVKLGKAFWVNPKNVKGAFKHECEADIFLKNGVTHAVIIDEKKKKTGIKERYKKIEYRKDDTYLISY